MNKADIMRIEHRLLSTIDGVATMDDTESFKTFGYMSGVNEMAKEIINFISEERKVGGIDE